MNPISAATDPRCRLERSVAVTLAATLLAFFSLACDDGAAAKRGEAELIGPLPETRLRVRIDPVRLEALPSEDRITATVRAFHRATITAETRGRVLERVVEPGAEVDMQCPFCRDEATGKSTGCNLCKGTTWIEIAGSGMVHPNVFAACGVDPEVYTGWAFGLGLDRMAMLKYAVTHLRLFFDGDVRFLEQFPC